MTIVVNAPLLLYFTQTSKPFTNFDQIARYIVKKKQDSVLDLIKGAHDAWSGMIIILKQSVFLWRAYEYYIHLIHHFSQDGYVCFWWG